MGTLGSVLTAMATPFDGELRLNLAGAEKLADHLVNHGSEGIVVAGTTGESPTLSSSEKLELFKAVKSAVAGRAKVLLGTGSNNTQCTVELTREAEKLGADAVMAVVPYYNKPPQEALYAHFKAIAQSTSLGVLMYNVPSRTGCNLEPGTVSRLAEIENIRYIKEASGNMDQVSAIRSQTDASFEIYSGDDSLTLPILALGGTGVVSVASHIVGREMKEMVNSFSQGNTAGAREIHLKLFPLFRALFMASNPIPLKAALNLMGLGVGGLRLPLVSLNFEEELRLRKVLDNFVET